MKGTHEVQAGGKLGMWLFCANEMVLFGGLFLLYSMYRFKNPAAFHVSSLELSRLFGTLNTCILLTSSFTAAISTLALKKGDNKKAGAFLLATVGLASAFLMVKGFEWAAKFEHGLYPNSPVLLTKSKGEILYFGLYFLMTGLHAVHVIVGIGVMLLVYVWIRQGKVSADRPVFFENTVLYWSIVDAIWLFLFPLFYLVT
jgi:cytochrome c oxidase subunit III